MLLSSFFLVLRYGIDKPIILPVLILNSIIFLSYLNNKYMLANLFSILIIINYYFSFNNAFILFLISIFGLMLYILYKNKKINKLIFLELFIFMSSLVYFVWVYLYNREYYTIENMILIIGSYFFIMNIVYFIYDIGLDIMNSYMTFKELQKENQIRVSLFKITHEIKNPIAVCKGYLDMLDINSREQVEKYVPIIKSEIERLLTILQDFLLINKRNMDFDIMDINLLVEDTLDKLNPLLEEKNIKVNNSILDDEIFINGDYNRLSQAIINIIKNSIEAISINGIINIKTEIKDNFYYLTVEDNGVGMTKEVISKIGNPFFTTKNSGTGLGVSLIYEIVEAHHGKIKYESEYGKGTKVILKLPLYQ